VVADSATPRDGQYLDALGTYNPLVKPADLRIDLDKVEKWLAEGAQMSDTVASLVRKARQGGDSKVAVRGVGPEEKPDTASLAAAAEPPAPAPAGSRGVRKAAPAEPAAPAASAEAEAEAASTEAETEPVESDAAVEPTEDAEPTQAPE
jgi:small subunit ribosomal protein S16